jgi:hypothetical protein
MNVVDEVYGEAGTLADIKRQEELQLLWGKVDIKQKPERWSLSDSFLGFPLNKELHNKLYSWPEMQEL